MFLLQDQSKSPTNLGNYSMYKTKNIVYRTPMQLLTIK